MELIKQIVWPNLTDAVRGGDLAKRRVETIGRLQHRGSVIVSSLTIVAAGLDVPAPSIDREKFDARFISMEVNMITPLKAQDASRRLSGA